MLSAVSRLSEIEAAADRYRSRKKQLLEFLTARVNERRSRTQTNDLSAFAGAIRLAETRSNGSDVCAASGNDWQHDNVALYSLGVVRLRRRSYG